MQPVAINEVFQDREEAGFLLSRRLLSYKSGNSVVVGIPRGGVPVASVIADNLSLPLEVVPCRRITDPRDRSRGIGSISEGEVFIHEHDRTIPQDYISHRVALLKHSVSEDNKRYYGRGGCPSFRNRTVILVDDLLVSGDTMMACLRGIRKQNPRRIVVAVPIVSAEALRIVGAEADDMEFLRTETCLANPRAYFAEFPKVTDQEVRDLLDRSRRNRENCAIVSSDFDTTAGRGNRM